MKDNKCKQLTSSLFKTKLAHTLPLFTWLSPELLLLPGCWEAVQVCEDLISDLRGKMNLGKVPNERKLTLCRKYYMGT